MWPSMAFDAKLHIMNKNIEEKTNFLRKVELTCAIMYNIIHRNFLQNWFVNECA